MKKESEVAIQQNIYEWANNTYCLTSHNPSLIIHSVPNGIGFNIPSIVPKQFHAAIRKTIAMSIDVLKKTGMVSGISDLIIHGVNGRCIMVEVKINDGKQSPNQIKIQNKVIALRGFYILVRSLEDFKLQFASHIDWLLGKY